MSGYKYGNSGFELFLGGILDSFHGTSEKAALSIASGNIVTTMGGGELGQGFYTGEHLHEAKQWALHSSRSKQNNVVKFVVDDFLVEQLDIVMFNHLQALTERKGLRKLDTTRTHTYGCDLVWAPIVGTSKISGDQYKWESNNAEILLNSDAINRVVL